MTSNKKNPENFNPENQDNSESQKTQETEIQNQTEKVEKETKQLEEEIASGAINSDSEESQAQNQEKQKKLEEEIKTIKAQPGEHPVLEWLMGILAALKMINNSGVSNQQDVNNQVLNSTDTQETNTNIETYNADPSHIPEFKNTLEPQDFSQYSGENPPYNIVDGKKVPHRIYDYYYNNIEVPSGSIAASMRHIGEKQRKMAYLVEMRFHQFGLSQPNLIKACLVNFMAESGLRPYLVGDGTSSLGLCQCNNVHFRENGKLVSKKIEGNNPIQNAPIQNWSFNMHPGDRFDPWKNIDWLICEEILQKRGNRLRKLAAQGGSVQKLAYLFSLDIERPAKKEISAQSRADKCAKFFPDNPQSQEDKNITSWLAQNKI